MLDTAPYCMYCNPKDHLGCMYGLLGPARFMLSAPPPPPRSLPHPILPYLPHLSVVIRHSTPLHTKVLFPPFLPSPFFVSKPMFPLLSLPLFGGSYCTPPLSTNLLFLIQSNWPICYLMPRPAPVTGPVSYAHRRKIPGRR